MILPCLIFWILNTGKLAEQFESQGAVFQYT